MHIYVTKLSLTEVKIKSDQRTFH